MFKKLIRSVTAKYIKIVYGTLAAAATVAMFVHMAARASLSKVPANWQDTQRLEQYSAVNDQEVMECFQTRRDRMHLECADGNASTAQTVRIHAYVPANLSVCILHKAASTVWMRLLLLLSYNDMNSTQIKSENKWNINHIYSNNVKKYYINDQRSTPIMGTVKIITARNPYSRLWSAYVDKFFNPVFSGIGKAIVYKYRPKPTMKVKNCGHDVTFAEFIDFVIDEGHHRGRFATHWLPATDVCHPCMYNPDFIVMFETFKRDLQAIIRTLGLSDTVGDMFSDDPTESTLRDELDVHLRYYEKVKRCMNETEYLLRIWKGMTFNGYFPPNKDLQKKFQNTSFEHSSLLDLVLTLRRQYGVDKGLSREFRHNALVDAYKQISKEQVASIQELYKFDFQMFGYNNTPPS